MEAFAESWHLYESDPVPAFADIENYGAEYATANAGAWDALRTGWSVPTPDLATVISTIRGRLGPIVDRASTPIFGVAA